jgi:hypothetical protein
MDGSAAMKNTLTRKSKTNFRTEVVYADKGQWQGFGLLADLILEKIMRRRAARTYPKSDQFKAYDKYTSD